MMLIHWLIILFCGILLIALCSIDMALIEKTIQQKNYRPSIELAIAAVYTISWVTIGKGLEYILDAVRPEVSLVVFLFTLALAYIAIQLGWWTGKNILKARPAF